MSAKDDNGAPVIYGVSHRDGITPVKILFTSDRRMAVDTFTEIEFDPTLNAGNRTENDVPVAHATSEDNDIDVLPWVVNEDTGRVLVDV